MWLNDYSSLSAQRYQDLLAEAPTERLLSSLQPGSRSSLFVRLLMWTADRLITAGESLRRSVGSNYPALTPAASER